MADDLLKEFILDDVHVREYVGGLTIIKSESETRYYQHNRLHRLDGPAIERNDGDNRWYLDGDRVDPIVHFITVGKL